MNRMLILGKNGLLARYAADYMKQYYDCTVIGRDDLDAREPDMNLLDELLSGTDHVVNCMGVVKPCIDDYGISATIKINAIFPEIIANKCNERDINFIHVSSDCVFDGKKGNYTENDNIYADDIYARTKGVTPCYGTTIRTSFIGENRDATYPGLLSWVLSHPPGSEIDGYVNCMWNGITCLQLCKYIRQIIACDQLWTGCRHVYSNRRLSKYELCVMINEIYDLGLKINEVEALGIMGTSIDDVLDRTLNSIYEPPIFPTIEQQITEQMQYGIR